MESSRPTMATLHVQSQLSVNEEILSETSQSPKILLKKSSSSVNQLLSHSVTSGNFVRASWCGIESFVVKQRGWQEGGKIEIISLSHFLSDYFLTQPTTSHLERASTLKIVIITGFFIFPVCSLCNEVYIKLSEQDTFIMKKKSPWGAISHL